MVDILEITHLGFIPHLNWFHILLLGMLALVSGVIGAGVQALIGWYRRQKAPIARRVDVFPRYVDPAKTQCDRSQLYYSDGQASYAYERTSFVQIQFTNQSDRSFEELLISITLAEGDRAIYLEFKALDQYHQLELLTPISFQLPQSSIEVVLRNFNRVDTYALRLLVVTATPEQEPGHIDFASPQAVRFVHLPTIVEAVQETARAASVGFGPFQISFDK